MLLVIGRYGDGHVKSIRISGFSQQFFCFLHILRIFVCKFRHVVFVKSREHTAADYGSFSVCDHIQDILTVHCITESLAYLYIIKRGFRIVQI